MSGVDPIFAGILGQWMPVPVPVETTRQETVTVLENAPFPPVPAIQPFTPQTVEPVTDDAPLRRRTSYRDLSAWDALSRGEQNDHRNTCQDGCGLCDGMRAFCRYCGLDVDPTGEHCENCGAQWPASIDRSVR